jgi:hypothetical protein
VRLRTLPLSLQLLKAIGLKGFSMSADRFFLAQSGHTVVALPPVNITGGVHSAAVNLKNYKHVSAIVAFGALSATTGLITLEACTSAAGAGAVAIPFSLYAQETTNGDVLGPVVAVPAAGYQPPVTPNISYVIELDTAAIPNSNLQTGSPLGLNYLRVSIADGANTDFATIVFILSGARYASDQSPTVLV